VFPPVLATKKKTVLYAIQNVSKAIAVMVQSVGKYVNKVSEIVVCFVLWIWIFIVKDAVV
jgi:hypothetical protein